MKLLLLFVLLSLLVGLLKLLKRLLLLLLKLLLLLLLFRLPNDWKILLLNENVYVIILFMLLICYGFSYKLIGSNNWLFLSLWSLLLLF